MRGGNDPDTIGGGEWCSVEKKTRQDELERQPTCDARELQVGTQRLCLEMQDEIIDAVGAEFMALTRIAVKWCRGVREMRRRSWGAENRCDACPNTIGTGKRHAGKVNRAGIENA